jgi:hypothetical protein
MGANLYADTTAADPAILERVRQGQNTTLMWLFSKRMRQMRPLFVMLRSAPRMKPAEPAVKVPERKPLAGGEGHHQGVPCHTQAHCDSKSAGSGPGYRPALTHSCRRKSPAMFNAAVPVVPCKLFQRHYQRNKDGTRAGCGRRRAAGVNHQRRALLPTLTSLIIGPVPTGKL